MADADQKPATTDGPFGSAGSEQEDGRNWVPMAVGVALVIVAVALIVIFARNSTSPNQPDPYAAKLQISNLHMETAENFAGGSVTYIEGTLANTGDRKVTSARVEVVFKNSLGELVQDERSLPVMVLQPDTPIVDYGPLDRAPIGPGRARDFRLTLEHITRDWDGQIPQIKVVAVSSS
jgi:hypothetical protein